MGGVRVTMKEILNIVKESKFNKELEITTDSCFSGKLCYEAKEWWEENKLVPDSTV